MSAPGQEVASRREPTGSLILGRYRIVRQLAAGGMGVVSLARAEGAAGFVKPVVVKRILPHLAEDEAVVQMFVREARILSNLQHPSIVGVLDFAQTEDAYVMVLEYVHGYSLASWRKYLRRTSQPFPVEAALHIVAETLDALHYAHTLKRADGRSSMVVHRDISPSNVLLDAHGRVKLTDFGIARMSSATNAYRTSENTVRGKFPYMAPELMSGAEPTAQSDVFACGVVLHELLAGRNEFARPDVNETILKVLQHEPSSLEEARQDVPPGIDAILAKALAKNPEARYPSAADFLAELRGVRSLSEEEAMADLAAQVGRDFFGDMPSVLGLEPLPTLEAAWRELTPDGTDLDAAVDALTDDSTDEATMTTSPAKALRLGAAAAGRRPSPRAVIAGGGVLLLAAVVGIGAWLGSRDTEAEPESQYIVVDRERPAPTKSAEAPLPEEPAEDDGTVGTSTDLAEPEPEPSAEPPSEPSEPAAKTRERNRPSRAAGGGGRALTRRFERKRNEVLACFEQHASDVAGQPELSVRFTVSRSGAVEQAEVLPAALSGTPLGRCVVRVAKGTSFGPQKEALSFRIPLNVQRR